MAIVGIGVDIVDLARFERALSRTPALRDRLFAAIEQSPKGRTLHLRSLAGRFAAKEALMKALGESTGVTWHDMQVVADDHGNPSLALYGAAKELADARGVTSVHLSMSHDAGVAIAYVIAESHHFGQIAPPLQGEGSEMVLEGEG
jgi:holo-[acyl-carrier protein] synthase